MKKIIGFYICSISLVVLSLPGFPQAGTLDSTFSDDGIAIFEFGVRANDVVALPDSTLIICGYMQINGINTGYIMRVLNDGEQDMTFGTDGHIEFQYGGFGTSARRLIILPDNKIIVSGHTKLSDTDREFFIARFLPDGSPDLTFNSTGHWVSSYSSGIETNNDMKMQADGKFVMAGSTASGPNLLFIRVNINGTIDNSFGTNGYAAISISASMDEYINGVDILSNGTIVGVGGYEYASGYYRVILAKLTASGNPMPGFGTNGIMVPALFNNYTDCSATELILENNSLLVTGSVYESIEKTFLARLDSSGTADAGFGTNGITVPGIDLVHIGWDIFRQMDGKLYVCGEVNAYPATDFILWRFMADGTLDFSFNSTGYVTTYIGNNNDLAFSIDLQPNGKIVLAGYKNGSDIALTRYLNDWAPAGCFANFSANPLMTCEAGQVSFTDQTVSTDSVAISWQWSFESGTPAVSSVQNPVITYNNDGVYNVQLIVSDGIYTDTLLRTDYIHVESIPAAPASPTGQTNPCQTYSYDYSTTSVPYADGYNWQVVPSEAGTITGDSTSAVFLASISWTGPFTIQVNAEGLCGTGPWSAPLNCELHHNPVLYQLSGTGDGGYCEGDPGSELTLDGSDDGVSYELYLDNVATGNIVEGTGLPISFGFLTSEGLYTVSGYTDFCSETMPGQVYVHQWDMPGQAETPVGPEETCDNESGVYTTEEIDEADWYVWSLDPAEAGELDPADDSLAITWNAGFSGTASLSVHGENDCGTGPESDPLEINISLSPDPVISGPQFVTPGSEEQYQTAENPGNTYSWEVTGGTIASGAGTPQVTVLWGTPGEGSVTVTEETAEGCSETTSPYSVTIDESIFIPEKQKDKISVYPNPFHDHCTIIVDQMKRSNITIEVTDMLGRQVSRIYQGYLDSGNHQFEWENPGITKSLYFLKAGNNNEFRVIKLMTH